MRVLLGLVLLGTLGSGCSSHSERFYDDLAGVPAFERVVAAVGGQLAEPPCRLTAQHLVDDDHAELEGEIEPEQPGKVVLFALTGGWAGRLPPRVHATVEREEEGSILRVRVVEVVAKFFTDEKRREDLEEKFLARVHERLRGAGW